MNGSFEPINGKAIAPTDGAVVDHVGMRKSPPSQGFSLVELMIVVTIAGILAAVAMPSFLEQIRKGRRSDAFDAMVLVQQQQERYRSQNAQYAPDFATLKVASASSAGHYQLSLSDVTAFGYTLKAKATAGGKQAGDATCTEFKLVVHKGSHERTATNGAAKDATTACWPQ